MELRTMELLRTPNSAFPEGRQIQAGCICLENRIGIAEVGALPGRRLQRPFRQFNHQPKGDRHVYQPIPAAVAGPKIDPAATAKNHMPTNEASSDSADVAKNQEALLAQRKGNPMKPVLRYQSQLLFRKSCKPNRIIRIRPVKLNFSFRPVRFGVKPQIKTYECETP